MRRSIPVLRGSLHPGLPTETVAANFANSEVVATSAPLEMTLVAKLPEVCGN